MSNFRASFQFVLTVSYLFFTIQQVDMILTAEHLLHVLHIHKYLGTVPSPVPPSKTEEFSFKRSAMKKVKGIICYLSGGEQVDAVKFQEALKYYQVRNRSIKIIT